jgi:DNA-binding transcriptional MerR regulator
MERRYRVGEFAALTGVSIRTLHHYDRIGLLSPSARSEAGYRLYSERDLLALQQVLTLRYLGFPLKQIGELLAQPEFSLITSLRIQRGALRTRIAELEQIVSALGDMLDRRLASGQWDWDLVARASAAVQQGLAQKGEDVQDQYTPERMKQDFEAVAQIVGPEEIQAVQDAWTAFLPEVQAKRDLDPASPEAQALAQRWDELTERTMRGYQAFPELKQAIANNYQEGRFEGHAEAPQQADFAFIERVKAARKTADESGPAGS